MLEDEVIFDSMSFKDQVLALLSQGHRTVALDLSGLQYLYSDSINALLTINRQFLDSNGKLAILAPSPDVMQVLQSAGILNFIKVYDTPADLLQASEDFIMQTSSFSPAALSATQAQTAYPPPQSEFDDFRSEISVAMDSQPQQSAPAPQQFQQPMRPTQQMPQQQYQQPQQQTYQQPQQTPQFEMAPPAPKAAAPVAATAKMDRWQEEEEESPKKGSPLVPILIAAIVVVGLGIGAFVMMSGKKDETPVTAAPAPQVETAKPAEVAPAPAQVAEPVAPPPATKPEPAKPAPKPAVVAKPAPAPKPVAAVRPPPPPPAPKPDPAPVAAPAPKGNKVLISSIPSGASVTIDGRNIGNTPVEFTPSGSGDLEVTASKSGYEDNTEIVEFKGGIQKVAITLEAKASASAPAPAAPAPAPVAAPAPAPASAGGPPATIFISSIPPVADIFIDGKPVGKTNIAKITVPSGTHTIKLTKAGKEYNGEITLQPGDNPAKNFTF